MADVFRIKRRATGGAAGAPTTLAAAEIAFNEQDQTLYYGAGNSGGNATTIYAIGGPGTFATKSTLGNSQWDKGILREEDAAGESFSSVEQELREMIMALTARIVALENK